MKKTILLLSLTVLLVEFGFTQKTSKGAIMASGSIGMSFNTSKYDDGNSVSTQGKSNTIQLNPNIGYFISDGLAVGAGINAMHYSFKNDGSADKVSMNTIALAPFVRYYTDMGLFGHGSVAFGAGSTKNINDLGGGATNETKEKIGIFGFEIGGGYAYFLNDNVAIEPLLLYSRNAIKNKTAAPNTSDINGGIQIRIGITIFL